MKHDVSSPDDYKTLKMLKRKYLFTLLRDLIALKWIFKLLLLGGVGSFVTKLLAAVLSKTYSRLFLPEEYYDLYDTYFLNNSRAFILKMYVHVQYPAPAYCYYTLKCLSMKCLFFKIFLKINNFFICYVSSNFSAVQS